MLRVFRTTPLARLMFCMFLKGFSKETNHLSLLDFFQLQKFPKNREKKQKKQMGKTRKKHGKKNRKKNGKNMEKQRTKNISKAYFITEGVINMSGIGHT